MNAINPAAEIPRQPPATSMAVPSQNGDAPNGGGHNETLHDIDNYQELPEAMRKANRWLVHRGKCPFYVDGTPRAGPLDSPEDLSRLASFEAALEALRSGAYDGLGFALGADGSGSYWQGVDLDETGDHPALTHIVDDLPGYTEKSPSGRGYHAIGYGRHYQTLGANQTGIEAYSEKRFFTVTADCSGRHEPCDLYDFVTSDLKLLHAKGNATQTYSVTSNPQLVDPKTITELRSALNAIPSDKYDTWIKVGLALKSLGEAGRGLWLDWSAQSIKYDPTEAARKWDSFQPTAISYETIFWIAQNEHGWINPLSNAANVNNREEATWQISSCSGIGGIDLGSCCVDLSEPNRFAPTHPHVIERLVPQGEVTLLAGHGGVGKSYISLTMAMAVALGRKFCNLPTQRRRVLFYSAEDDEAELRRRISKICSVWEIETRELIDWLIPMDVSNIDNLLFRLGHSEAPIVTSMFHQLAAYVDQRDIGLIVIDNASEVFGGSEVIRVQVRAFMRQLRNLARPDRAVLLLTHISKFAASSRSTVADDYSGSTAWHNSARSRISVETKDKTVERVMLTHQKANKSPKADPIEWEWRDGIPLPVDEIDIHPLVDSMRRRQEEEMKNALLLVIQEFETRGEPVTTSMNGGHTTFKTLKNELGFPPGVKTSDQCNKLIRDLEREGRIERYVSRRNGKERERFRTAAAVLNRSPNLLSSEASPSSSTTNDGYPVQ
jgi:hypothetical protein